MILQLQQSKNDAKSTQGELEIIIHTSGKHLMLFICTQQYFVLKKHRKKLL